MPRIQIDVNESYCALLIVDRCEVVAPDNATIKPERDIKPQFQLCMYWKCSRQS